MVGHGVFLGVTGKERAALWEMYSGLACAGAVRLVTFARPVLSFSELCAEDLAVHARGQRRRE